MLNAAAINIAARNKLVTLGGFVKTAVQQKPTTEAAQNVR